MLPQTSAPVFSIVTGISPAEQPESPSPQLMSDEPAPDIPGLLRRVLSIPHQCARDLGAYIIANSDGSADFLLFRERFFQATAWTTSGRGRGMYDRGSYQKAVQHLRTVGFEFTSQRPMIDGEFVQCFAVRIRCSDVASQPIENKGVTGTEPVHSMQHPPVHSMQHFAPVSDSNEMGYDFVTSELHVHSYVPTSVHTLPPRDEVEEKKDRQYELPCSMGTVGYLFERDIQHLEKMFSDFDVPRTIETQIIGFLQDEETKRPRPRNLLAFVEKWFRREDAIRRTVNAGTPAAAPTAYTEVF